MKIAVKRINVWSAFKFGLIYSPIMYTINRFTASGGGFGVGLGDYLSGIVGALILGGVLSAVGAYLYNLIAARWGPLKLEITVEDK